jgi:gamma-glutamyltranspeptidase / glutathione hydrolase
MRSLGFCARVRALGAPALALSLGLAAGAVPAPRAMSSEGGRYRHYAVAADHPAASEAGARVLAQGGSAADAAAAVMLALGVVSPAGSGLGGGGFALYYSRRERSFTFLDFRETAPRAITPEVFSARPGDTPEQAAARSRVLGLAVAVPGEPRGIEMLQRRFGKLSLAQVVAPAEALARGGFEVSPHIARMLGVLGLGQGIDPLFASVFGAPSAPAANAKNPALAATLRAFGKRGADELYRGQTARALVKRVRAAGGVLSAEDLAGYRVVERAPLVGAGLGLTWVSAPPPSAGGYTLLSSLAFLDALGGAQTVPQGAARMHLLAESWKGPYLDRAAYFGDPDHVDVPLAALSDPARRRTRAERFHPVLATPPESYALPLAPGPTAQTAAADHGTSHLCVVDAEGNVAAVTTTVNLPFGAQISAAGLWLNDEMDDFAREVGKDNAFGLVGGAPNLPAPGKRPVSSMSPTIVLEGDEPRLCIGGSGGSRIPTAVEQVALYVLADGLSPEEALLAPRVHHQGSPDRVELRAADPALAKELRARGHTLVETQNSANVQLVLRTPDGVLAAASDPNKGGAPRGE